MRPAFEEPCVNIADQELPSPTRKRRDRNVFLSPMTLAFMLLIVVASTVISCGGHGNAQGQPADKASEAVTQFLDKCKAGEPEEALQEYAIKNLTLPGIVQGDFEYKIMGTELHKDSGDYSVYVHLTLPSGEVYGVTFRWSQVGNEITAIGYDKQQPPPQ